MEVSRRYDIDWLRVIAIGLLIIYHIGIAFQPWGVFIGFIQNDEPIEALWIPLSMLNIWRIPLLFFVSGMGVWFAIRRRNWKQLLTERTKRILLPFVFGMLVIVPLHVFIWQWYYKQDIRYMVNPAHLWFLGNIFMYVLLFSPLFFYLKNNGDKMGARMIRRAFRSPLILPLLMIPFVAESELISPDSFEIYAMTWHGFFLGMAAFVTGFICVFAGEGFWQTVRRSKWVLLLLAVAAYAVRLTLFDLRTPDFLMSVESCLWIFAIFGFGYQYLNRPGHLLTYLSQAAYPVYIVHMFFLYLGSVILFPLELPVVMKFLLLIVFTVLGCFLMYEYIIRRIRLLRPLFGLKLPPAEPRVETV